MSEIEGQHNDDAGTSRSHHSATSHFLRQQLPYIIALVLAIAGVAYTNVSHQPLVGYWEFLALAIAVVWNPVWPLPLGDLAIQGLSIVGAVVFVAAAVTIKIPADTRR